MNQLQSRLLDIFKWFHQFCKENDLTYYAIAGTTLGAVRHQGFIPWDDDIDVALPRADYDKLLSLMEGKTFGKYILEKPLQNKDFVYGISKIYDTTTTVVEPTRYNTKRGIYLDIFPLDGIGNDFEQSANDYMKIKKKMNWVSAKTCAIRKDRKGYKNLAIVFARCIPEFICGWRKTAKKIDDKLRQKKFEDYDYVVNAYGDYRTKEICKREIYGTPKLVKFEDAFIYVPEKVEEYLTGVYGDFMTPPPVEKQVSHHGFVHLDLEKSYLEK